MPSVIKKEFLDITEEELLGMTREEVTLDMTDKQIIFCEQYVKNFNPKMAAIKAGYNPASAHIMGYKLRKNHDVVKYILWLKLHVSKDCHITAMDIIDKYVRIAFADMTDFVTIENNKLRLTNGAQIDGQLVNEVKQGKDGVSIKLVDKLKALEKLEKYFDIMPKDWKEKIEEKKIELMEKRLQLDELKIKGVEGTIENDNFINALCDTATEVWDSTESNIKE